MSNHFQITALQEQLKFQTEQTMKFAAVADSANKHLNEMLEKLRLHDPKFVRSFLGEPEPVEEGTDTAAPGEPAEPAPPASLAPAAGQDPST